jgi:subtilisin-like proprotein convertase family protein
LPTGAPANIEVSHTYNPIHTWAGDVDVTLIAPNGTSHILYAATGDTVVGSAGDSSDLSGPYNFKDSAAGTNWWLAAFNAGATVAVPPGDYRTTQAGPQPVNNFSPVTNMTAAFAGVANPNGTWTMRFTDTAAGDTGSVSAASLTITGRGGTCTPTAAGVEVSGRVVTAEGYGLRNARVVLTDSNGVARTAITSSFGYYRFEDVPAGETYVIGVVSKRYTFTSRILEVLDNLADVDFMAEGTSQ